MFEKRSAMNLLKSPLVSAGRTPFSFLRTGLILLLTIGMVAGGCKKDSGDDDEDDGDTEYYMRFKLDGNQIEYKSGVVTQVLPISNKALYSCVLQGYGKFPEETGKNHLGIIIWDEEPITTITYRNNQNTENSDGDKVPQVLMTHLNSETTSYLSQGVPAAPIPPFDKIVSDVQVTITELTNTRISGSFSGTLYKTTDATFTSTVSVTEGKFRLKRL